MAGFYQGIAQNLKRRFGHFFPHLQGSIYLKLNYFGKFSIVNLDSEEEACVFETSLHISCNFLSIFYLVLIIFVYFSLVLEHFLSKFSTCEIESGKFSTEDPKAAIKNILWISRLFPHTFQIQNFPIIFIICLLFSTFFYWELFPRSFA